MITFLLAHTVLKLYIQLLTFTDALQTMSKRKKTFKKLYIHRAAGLTDCKNRKRCVRNKGYVYYTYATKQSERLWRELVKRTCLKLITLILIFFTEIVPAFRHM